MIGRKLVSNYYSNNQLATATFLWQLRDNAVVSSQIGQSQCAIQFNNVHNARYNLIMF